MKSGQLWTIIGVALVVAIVASIATVSITGNIIRQNNNPSGAYQVYTKVEIDRIISNLTIKFSDSNNVGIALNKRVYSVTSEKLANQWFIDPVFGELGRSYWGVRAYCKDANDFPISGYCQVNNNPMGDHGVFPSDLTDNRPGGFSCNAAPNSKSDYILGKVYCLNVE